MTAKQKTKIDKLIECSGRGPVQAYIWYFYPGVEVENLSTVQAQKLITGFGMKLPKPIFGVHLREA